ncbi:MAG TPA: serine/threonine-protein kinase, partial [Dehalococcoidia bacterium]
MKCLKCQAENREGAKFCISCAQPLVNEVVCSYCQHANPRGARFCEECANPLGESAPIQQSTKSPSPSSTPSSPLPTSFANGRYTVKKFLGEGGKKKVYLAHDTVLDRDVAFALIKTEKLDEAARTRIKREAQAMGKLGDHPNIVSIYEMSDEHGQPYIVLPLMAGGDVDGLIEKAPDHRLPLDKALEIAEAVCRGLEFAHAKGIIHRDLKPGNVWLTAGGVAQIGDFGLAVAIDRSRLTHDGMMVGTVSYMPPEQAMGGKVTSKADLYSLGAMLYEMVTGRPPFVGDDSVAIIGQHIQTPPVSPTWHRADLPPAREGVLETGP